jgi:hypothetical protein
MSSRVTFPRRRMRFLALALIAVPGFAGWSSLASASAVASPERTVVLSGDSVGSVRFGEPQRSAVSELTRLIGAPQGGVQDSEGNCTIDAALDWASFSAYFFGGRFVGYQTGSPDGKREPTFNGKTQRDLRIGDSLGEARVLYPGHVTTSGENGGVYAITTSTGTIRGYLSLEVASPPDKIKIVSISAGSVGCPADSPG